MQVSLTPPYTRHRAEWHSYFRNKCMVLVLLLTSTWEKCPATIIWERLGFHICFYEVQQYRPTCNGTMQIKKMEKKMQNKCIALSFTSCTDLSVIQVLQWRTRRMQEREKRRLPWHSQIWVPFSRISSLSSRGTRVPAGQPYLPAGLGPVAAVASEAGGHWRFAFGSSVAPGCLCRDSGWGWCARKEEELLSSPWLMKFEMTPGQREKTSGTLQGKAGCLWTQSPSQIQNS